MNQFIWDTRPISIYYPFCKVLYFQEQPPLGLGVEIHPYPLRIFPR